MLKATSLLLQKAGFTGPELLVDEAQARRNIATMAARARAGGARFRPHFKTHQSAAVGRWFADEGVTAITVSSLQMAEYFADHGWRDITLALLLNPRQWPALEDLARRLDAAGGRLGVTVDNPAVAHQLAERADLPLDVWLKLDTGYGRTGVRWDDQQRLAAITEALAPHRGWQGLLTHSGHAYAVDDDAGRRLIWQETLERLLAVRDRLGRELEISVGDTPCCRTLDSLDGPDEVRPGNFVFFDLMQWSRGVCRSDELASGLVCPVLGIYPEDHRLVVHGGAVHLSREALINQAGQSVYGYVGRLDGRREVLTAFPVSSLSQEHGVLQLTPDTFPALAADLEVGDLLFIWPVHSCLSCDLTAVYRTLEGQTLTKLP